MRSAGFASRARFDDYRGMTLLPTKCSPRVGAAFLVAAFATSGGCSSGSGGPDLLGSAGHAAGGSGGHPAGGAGNSVTVVIGEQVDRDLDVVFVVDNSSSMSKAQTNLLNSVPTFFDTLKAMPGGMPNLHLAVVSSDMGAGTGTAGCAGNGRAGVFQWGGPTSTCPATTDGARFLSNVDGSANYSGDIASVFSCVAALGEEGCGFEQTLLSLTRALGADNFDNNGRPQPPQENQGFLRDGAYLAIVLLTNEDDCSAPAGAASDLFPRSGDSSTLSTPLGPPTGYRCNAFGHLCGSPAAPPPILSPRGAADPGDATTIVDLDDCTSNEDTSTGGKLIPVSAFASVIKALKADPNGQILVAAIGGLYPDTAQQHPYAVTWRTSPSQDPAGPWPEMVHSCVSAGDGSFADPAVRIGEWVKTFGRNGMLQSICDTSFRPAMQRVGQEIGRLMGPPCINGPLSSSASTETYDCTVTETTGGTKTQVPSCEKSGGAHPCWHLEADALCLVPAGSPAGSVSRRLFVDQDGVPPADLTTTITCRLQ
jgi:hypothetical protein